MWNKLPESGACNSVRHKQWAYDNMDRYNQMRSCGLFWKLALETKETSIYVVVTSLRIILLVKDVWALLFECTLSSLMYLLPVKCMHDCLL